jgi:hypothetical protein
VNVTVDYDEDMFGFVDEVPVNSPLKQKFSHRGERRRPGEDF